MEKEKKERRRRETLNFQETFRSNLAKICPSAEILLPKFLNDVHLLSFYMFLQVINQ